MPLAGRGDSEDGVRKVRHNGCSIEDAMRLATKAAGIAVQRKGAAASIPEIKELK